MKYTPSIFEVQPKLTNADRKALAPHISGWNKLCEFLKTNPDSATLKKLVLLECERPIVRPVMVKKMIGKLNASQRQAVLITIGCLNET